MSEATAYKLPVIYEGIDVLGGGKIPVSQYNIRYLYFQMYASSVNALSQRNSTTIYLTAALQLFTYKMAV